VGRRNAAIVFWGWVHLKNVLKEKRRIQGHISQAEIGKKRENVHLAAEMVWRTTQVIRTFLFTQVPRNFFPTGSKDISSLHR